MNLPGKCYCESLMAYAQECKRLNVEVGDWKNISLCSPNAAPRVVEHRNVKSKYDEELQVIIRNMSVSNKTKLLPRSRIPLIPLN